MTDRSISICIVDDHPVYVDGLANLLNREGDMQVVAVAYDGKAALSLLREHQPDILLLDLEMPYHGFKVLADLGQMQAACRVLVVSGYSKAADVQRVQEMGGDGYVPKTEPLQALLQVIRQVVAGWSMFLDSPASQRAASDDLLSMRELDVLDQLSRGLTNSEIAANLNISKNTVGYHLKNIFSKINVNNRTEATVWYFANMSSFA